MKTVFFGTPAFATPFLKALIDDLSIEVVAVVTQPDKPRGRGGDLSPSPVKVMAQDHAIPVLQPKSLKKDPNIQGELARLGADCFVVVAYGKFLPADILETPPHGSINVHPSLLPRHRGPSPMQWAIAEGDTQTGVTIMILDEGMDTGPLLASSTISLDGEETYSTLQEKVHEQGPRLLVDSMKAYVTGDLKPVPQDDEKATITRLLDKEDGHVDWNQPMSVVERKARAYEGWPGSWSLWKRSQGVEIRLKWVKMRPVDFNADVAPGTVVIKEGKLYIDTKDGTLEVLEVQPEGKPKMNASAFIQGYKDIDGDQMI